MLVQGSREPGEGARRYQQLGHDLGYRRGHWRSVSGALGAAMESRVAGGTGSGTPLCPDDRRTEAAQEAQPTGCSPARRAERRPRGPMPGPGWMYLPPRDGTKVSRSSSARAFSGSRGSCQLRKSGNPPRGLLPARPGELGRVGSGGLSAELCRLRAASRPEAWITPRPPLPAATAHPLDAGQGPQRPHPGPSAPGLG